jgi:hypothetical protein
VSSRPGQDDGLERAAVALGGERHGGLLQREAVRDQLVGPHGAGVKERERGAHVGRRG